MCRLAAVISCTVMLAAAGSLPGSAGPEQKVQQTWPLEQAYGALHRGDYQGAVSEAQQALSKHADDTMLVWRAHQVTIMGLMLLGDEKGALQHMDRILKQYASDVRKAGQRTAIPMNLRIRSLVASSRERLYRRRGNCDRAIEAYLAFLEAEKRSLACHEGSAKELARLAVDGVFRAELGHRYKCCGKWALAKQQYQRALEFVRQYKPPAETAGMLADPPEQHLARSLPELIEQCDQAASSPAAAGYALEVDCKVEIGDFHRVLAEGYSSAADREKARLAYESALDYLREHGAPTALGSRAERRYRRLLEETLPSLVAKSGPPQES